MSDSNHLLLDPELDLVLERVIDVPRESIWAAWTRPELLMRWFTPAPWRTVECEIDARPGGIFRTVMRGPGGEESGGAGCVLGAGGAAHHLFDPRSGRSAAGWKAVTVHHRSAAVADALSTAFYVASAEEITALLPRFPGTLVWARDYADHDRRWTAAPVDGVVNL